MSPELTAQRRITTAFINTMPVTLTLTPREKVRTPAGGYRWVDQPARDPQVMRLIEPSSYPQRPTVSSDGVEREVMYELLGEWDAQVAVGDSFSYLDKQCEVIEMLADNGWEKRAWVALRG